MHGFSFRLLYKKVLVRHTGLWYKIVRAKYLISRLNTCSGNRIKYVFGSFSSGLIAACPALVHVMTTKSIVLNGRIGKNGAMSMLRRDDICLDREQVKFLNALRDISGMLDRVGMKRDDWMVIAGGGVFLYQLEKTKTSAGASPDRAPTDIDIVIRNGHSDRTYALRMLNSLIGDENTSLRTEPYNHFGHVFRGPALSWKINGLDVDFLTELPQTYSPSNRFLPGKDFDYPEGSMLLSDAISIKHPFIDGSVRVAHPMFIAFYKLMLDRNDGGKQDLKDLRRLKEMGLLNPEALDSARVLRALCHDDKTLFERISKAMTDV